MALDATQIDPVTGVPLITDYDVIEQIPLGKQMFDWESYDATSRMARPPIYGDDVLPTVTNVQGQHPSTGSAQSVRTDGNHALLVSDVSGGGSSNGFPIPMPLNSVQNNGWYSTAHAPGDEAVDLGQLDDTDYIIGIGATAVIDPSASIADNSYAMFYLELNQSGDDRWLLSGSLAYKINGAECHAPTWTGQYTPPIPIAPPGGSWYGWKISIGYEGTLPFELMMQVITAPMG